MNIEKLKNFLYRERQAIDAISTTIKQNMASIMAIAASVAIPAVPAIFAANGIYQLTANWAENWRIASTISGGIAVEGAGMFLALLAAKTYAAWRKSAASSNETIAVISAVILYIVISIALIAFSDVPTALKIIVGLIPLLGVAFYIGIGFETDLTNRLDEIADEKRRKSEEVKAAKAQKIAAQKPQNAGVILQLPKSQWRNYAEQVYQDDPGISGAELARKIGCSERTGQNILKQIRK